MFKDSNEINYKKKESIQKEMIICIFTDLYLFVVLLCGKTITFIIISIAPFLFENKYNQNQIL